MKIIKIFLCLFIISMLFVSCPHNANEGTTNNTLGELLVETFEPFEVEDIFTVSETACEAPKLTPGTPKPIPNWTKQETGLSVTIPDVITDLSEPGSTNVTPELKAAMYEAMNTKGYFKKPKNVILMFSDGMGVRQVQASKNYRGELIMTQLPFKSQAETHTYEMANIITDSAAGGTALSAGYKTTKLFVSMDAYGHNLKTVTELAQEKGMKVGVVSNAEMADATPATFTIHNKNRSNAWTKMCRQQILYPVDLFFGNGDSDYKSYFGDKQFTPTIKENNMKRYTSFSKLISEFGEGAPTGIKTYALFDVKDTIGFARHTNNNTTTPNLQEMTKYTLSWLQKEAGDNGFFCIIENTWTDIYGHGHNDGLQADESNVVGIVNEVQSTDECVAICLKYVLENPDTVLIVTADHDTGNMKFKTGWEDDMSKAVADSGDHSLQNVPVFAIGYGMRNAFGTDFEKVRSNAYTGQVIGKALGARNFGDTDGNNKYSSNVKSAKFAAADADPSASTYRTNLEFTKDIINGAYIVTFKIKPENYKHITVTDAKGNVCVDGDIVARSSTTYNWEKKVAAPVIAEAYECAKWWSSDSEIPSTLPDTYSVGDVTYKKLNGWYQIGFKAPANSDSLTIELTGGNNSANKAIDIDDLTVQFASTIGEINVNGVAAKYK